MKKPKKIDQVLLDLEAEMHKAVDEMFNSGFSKKKVLNYQEKVAKISDYQQKKKAEKPTKAKLPCVNEYKIVR